MHRKRKRKPSVCTDYFLNRIREAEASKLANDRAELEYLAHLFGVLLPYPTRKETTP